MVLRSARMHGSRAATSLSSSEKITASFYYVNTGMQNYCTISERMTLFNCLRMTARNTLSETNIQYVNFAPMIHPIWKKKDGRMPYSDTATSHQDEKGENKGAYLN